MVTIVPPVPGAGVKVVVERRIREPCVVRPTRALASPLCGPSELKE
jgi:hypothetical protein